MAFKGFHLCNSNLDHFWFVSMAVHGFCQVKEKSDLVPTEDNLAKELLDKNNFPWRYCARRLLNKQSNLWRERPLWVLFMSSWRENFQLI